MPRVPLPDEIVPVELLDDGRPHLQFSGRAIMDFQPDEKGRRIEWTTPELAKVITSEPYNRMGQPARFRVAEDLRPQNLNIDQRVLETIRLHAKAIAAILAPEFEQAQREPAAVQCAAEVPYVAQDPPSETAPAEEASTAPEEHDIDSMDKAQLVEWAKDHDVNVDARWNVSKIRETIHRQAVVGA